VEAIKRKWIVLKFSEGFSDFRTGVIGIFQTMNFRVFSQISSLRKLNVINVISIKRFINLGTGFFSLQFFAIADKYIFIAGDWHLSFAVAVSAVFHSFKSFCEWFLGIACAPFQAKGQLNHIPELLAGRSDVVLKMRFEIARHKMVK
jgi:hypothetical protein